MSLIKVKVSQGIVRGCEEELPDGRKFLRFSGIPYAQPPQNNLRFRPPVKLIKFDEPELDCTRERDACIHKSTLSGKYVGSEDCLNLNVYVPAEVDPLKRFAVMVYIHGGALKYDSNSKEIHSPEYLLMENVIVVTINYRLHVLGFLSFPQMGISGNMGLKDQQMALEWIHDNIANFNGDPNKICLFGESAGAVCVHFHILNRKSRQFIKSAICQSGSVFSERYFQNHSEERIKMLVRRLGCKSESMENIYETLMAASAKDLYDNCDNVLMPLEPSTGFRNKWRMVVEEESDDAFITQSPLDSIISQAGEINFPVIFGTNNGDGIPTAAKLISRKMLDFSNIRSLIPRSVGIEIDDDAKDLLELIKKFYFLNQDLSENNTKELVKLLSDLHYLIDQTKANELHAQYHPESKQFLYEFQFVGALNIQKKLSKTPQIPFASHADDVFYLFGGTLAERVKLTEASRECKMRRTMCKLWTNFAKYGNPTPDHENPLSIKWNAVQPIVNAEIEFDYLTINDDIKLVRNLNKDRMDFWRSYRKRHDEGLMRARL